MNEFNMIEYVLNNTSNQYQYIAWNSEKIHYLYTFIIYMNWANMGCAICKYSIKQKQI